MSRFGEAWTDVLQRPAERVAFVVLPATLLLLMVEFSVSHDTLAFDFHHSFWRTGHSVLTGNFAYNPHFDGTFDPWVYPPLTAVLFAPFGALPVSLAVGIYTAIGILAVFFALWAFGVRDRRCYGAAFLWPPVLAAVQSGNLSLVLLGGLGLMWALRTRPFPLGVTMAVLVTSKLFIAPVCLWLLVTRRYRAAAWSAVAFVVLNVTAWFAIGAGSLGAYIDLVQRHTRGEEWDTYTLKVLAARLGLPAPFGTAATLLAVAAILAAWWMRHRADDRATLATTVLVSLVISPIVWLHYLALLLVPVALMRRSLSWIWLVPLVTIVCPGRGSGGLPQTMIGVAAILAVAFDVLWRAPAREVPERAQRALGVGVSEPAGSFGA
jgi:Glycosyltransferase family 87